MIGIPRKPLPERDGSRGSFHQEFWVKKVRLSVKNRLPCKAARGGERGSGLRFVAIMPFAIALIGAAPQHAEDPDWPCQQRLVPRLAAAAYWNGPLDMQGDWQTDPEVTDLVRHLSPRRVTTEEGLAEIANFAKTASKDRPHRLALVFRGLVEETDRERADLIEKLKQMGRRQRELADLVARLADELNSVPPNANGEAADKRVDLQQRHDFTARNFEEIRRTVRYACETPVELDARLGAWARALQQAANAAAPG